MNSFVTAFTRALEKYVIDIADLWQKGVWFSWNEKYAGLDEHFENFTRAAKFVYGWEQGAPEILFAGKIYGKCLHELNIMNDDIVERKDAVAVVKYHLDQYRKQCKTSIEQK